MFMYNCDNLMEHISVLIENASQQELQILMDAIQDRYAQLFPDWDILYMALPKADPQQREHLVNQIIKKIRTV